MPALRDLQAAFAAHLGGEDRVDLADAVVGDTLAAAARLRIHRHHVRHSLASALAATFPTVQALVGESFFGALAADFVGANLPGQPVLTEYGAGFPAYVAGHDRAATLPYLGDVARLDWALNLAYHAPMMPRLEPSDLAGRPAERLFGVKLALAAGTMLIRSPWPIDRIWHATQPGASSETVSLDEGSASVLVLRRLDDAAFASLDSAEAAFVEVVAGGLSLGEAAESAFSSGAAFDPSTTFARLLSLGAFAALQHEA